MPTLDPIPPEVLDALRRRDPLEAIKLLRKTKGLGLKEAKERLDQHLRAAHAPSSVQTGRGLQEAKDVLETLRRSASASQRLSPGQVRDTGSGFWWLVVVGFAALLVYRFLRG